MISSMPREVNGKWYPVPCPEGVTLVESFASEAECAAFIRAVDILAESWDEREDELVRKMQEDADANEEQSYDNGHMNGYEEGHREGWDAGYEEGRKVAEELARSAESAQTA